MCPWSFVANGAEKAGEMRVGLGLDDACGRWNAEVQEVRRWCRFGVLQRARRGSWRRWTGEMHVVQAVDDAGGRWNAEVQEVRRCCRRASGDSECGRSRRYVATGIGSGDVRGPCVHTVGVGGRRAHWCGWYCWFGRLRQRRGPQCRRGKFVTCELVGWQGQRVRRLESGRLASGVRAAGHCVETAPASFDCGRNEIRVVVRGARGVGCVHGSGWRKWRRRAVPTVRRARGRAGVRCLSGASLGNMGSTTRTACGWGASSSERQGRVRHACGGAVPCLHACPHRTGAALCPGSSLHARFYCGGVVPCFRFPSPTRVGHLCKRTVAERSHDGHRA